MGGKPLTIQDLLKISGLDTSKRIKLVRHADRRYGITLDNVIGQENTIVDYQRRQRDPVFHETDYIVVFIGGGKIGTKALFVGVYKVKSERIIPEKVALSDKYLYEFEEMPQFNNLKWRVIIEWGKSTQKWYQNFTNPKKIIGIWPEGWYYKSFPGYEKLIISFKDLQYLMENEFANPEWVGSLSSVGGVYLITYKKTGEHYVGSAYGKGGIWKRWKNYVQTKHGNNKLLQELLKKDSHAYESFIFSILKIFPQTISKDEIIKWEKIFKDKLGTRAHGLNLN